VRKLVNQAKFGWCLLKLKISGCARPAQLRTALSRGVEIIDVMRSVRRLLVPDGVVPPVSQPAQRDDRLASSVTLGAGAQRRANWAKELGVKEFTEGTECCISPAAIPVTNPG